MPELGLLRRIAGATRGQSAWPRAEAEAKRVAGAEPQRLEAQRKAAEEAERQLRESRRQEEEARIAALEAQRQAAEEAKRHSTAAAEAERQSQESRRQERITARRNALKLWNQTGGSRDPADMRRYLDAYPAGEHADLA